MNDKTIIILRGVSGSGKSTLAEKLVKNRNGVICCADDYFIHNGIYQFDITKLDDAHRYCRKKFDDALKNPEVEIVVVANTNTKESDWKYYQTNAESMGFIVHFVVVENRHHGVDIHNVPSPVLAKQQQNILNSLSIGH